MEFSHTRIPEIIILIPKIFRDSRGEFLETFRSNDFSKAGINCNFIQENHAGSVQGVLRGLHYQIKQAQGKLIRVITGQIFDVAVDLRKSSSSFGQAVGILLTEQEKNQLWIPPGFAHGYYVLSDWAEVSYKVTDYYAPQWERTLLWNDPALKINWPLIKDSLPILSENDLQGKTLQEADLYE